MLSVLKKAVSSIHDLFEPLIHLLNPADKLKQTHLVIHAALLAKGFPKDDISLPKDASGTPLYNLRIPIVPAVIVSPRSARDVAIAVKVAKELNLKVQAKSGGHNFANYCLGGISGQMSIDLKHLQQFRMDRKTWRATVGGGTLLADVTQRLHDNGGRAIAHGVCPQVGIGGEFFGCFCHLCQSNLSLIKGHATMGGMGPASRQWGLTLDAVREVEVVTADGEIVTANETQNVDLFWVCLLSFLSYYRYTIDRHFLRRYAAPVHLLE
jgi:FAD/FMN-containing dehydrogenase